MTKPYVRLDKNDAAVLLVDHQAGLLSLVRDIEPDKFKNKQEIMDYCHKRFDWNKVTGASLRLYIDTILNVERIKKV